MQNDDTGSIAATTVVVAVHLDLASRRVCSLPADVRERGIVMMDNGTAVDRRVGDHEVERAVCSAALLSV